MQKTGYAIPEVRLFPMEITHYPEGTVDTN